MASAQQLIGMIKSHAAGDDERFLLIAEHIAQEADNSGKVKMAGEIKALIESIRIDAARARIAKPIPITAPRGELAGLVRASYPEIYLSDLVLSSQLERRITRIVREHRERSTLEAKNLAPRRKFLFSGPPGTGKGMTARAIAGELGLPLFTILLDGVITKFMGETASKLRLIFDAMATTRGIYFFDEVDALAASRGSENDVGEARRMLNSFLQFLEEDQSGSVIIAATNHRSLLDPALFRRFDAALFYEKPSAEEARRVLNNHLLAFDVDKLDWNELDLASHGLSQADLVAAAADAARDAVLDNDAKITTELLKQALKDRNTIHPN
ncbi:ATPase family associated with various cellular activities (AAA) [Devosia enhydra]|uniref:ATPase family associated with various cellular activities (AAA) n=1 Tax=Devosia enhydra TaxID=665118 RepID=A0A1K2HXL4_9HYPH|nr:ATP-binding protein [Devosia enhydra]SFZ84470.1 ATPase family associated with various cellular activities (AAA) [Devosia enhydra]